jgi:putative FmdB family regulatory protein
MVYAYACDKCGTGFTVRATVAEKTRGLDLRCPKCGEKEVTQDLRGVGMAFGGQGTGGGLPWPPGCGSGAGAGCC